MDRDRIGTGRDGEALAAAYLKKHGLEIVERNLRCPLGEVDLIARDGPTYVFVEIRSQRSNRRGAAEESVGPEKRKRVVRVALWYLKRLGLDRVPVRFDVVTVRWRRDEAQVRWIPGAFDAHGAV